jgi:hypothetical protein
VVDTDPDVPQPAAEVPEVQEPERRAAVPKAPRLERRELLHPGHGQGDGGAPDGQPGRRRAHARTHPRAHRGQLAERPGYPERDQAERRPGQQVPARQRGPATGRAFLTGVRMVPPRLIRGAVLAPLVIIIALI